MFGEDGLFEAGATRCSLGMTFWILFTIIGLEFTQLLVDINQHWTGNYEKAAFRDDELVLLKYAVKNPGKSWIEAFKMDLVKYKGEIGT